MSPLFCAECLPFIGGPRLLYWAHHLLAAWYNGRIFMPTNVKTRRKMKTIKENEDVILKQGIIPEFSSGSSTHVVMQQQASKILKPIRNETPYKDTTGRGPAVKAAVQGLSHFMVHGFTLIELLVVVLIIGILAAIALPQYQKAVEKARLAEALTRIPAIEKAMDLWALEHGYDEVDFFAQPPTKVAESDIDILSGLRRGTGSAESDNYEYTGYCTFRGGNYTSEKNVCYYTLLAQKGDLALEGSRAASQNQWAHYCEYDEDSPRAVAICEQLYKQGWEQGDVFF